MSGLGVRATSLAERGGRVGILAGDARGIEAEAVDAVPVRLVTELAFDPPVPSEQREAFEELPMGVASKLAVLPRGPAELRDPVRGSALLVLGRRRRRWNTAPGRDPFAGSELPQEGLATGSGDPATGCAGSSSWLRACRTAPR